MKARLEQQNNATESAVSKYIQEQKEILKEIRHECLPQSRSQTEMFSQIRASLKYFRENWIHIPYLPAFHRPGWMLRYLVGPYDANWLDSFIADVWAGVPVALTLIPQVSYSTKWLPIII